MRTILEHFKKEVLCAAHEFFRQHRCHLPIDFVLRRSKMIEQAVHKLYRAKRA